MNAIVASLFDSLRQISDRTILYLPKLLTAIAILVVGMVLALLTKWAVSRILRISGLDRLSQKIGATQSLIRGGVKEPLSLLIAKLVAGLVLITFVFGALLALDLPTSESLFERLLLYLPNVLVALVVLVVGFAVANFLGRAVLIASVNAGLRMSGLLARLTRVAIFLIAMTMAFEQLGVGRETVTVAFAIVFGGAVLAFALALGLGGQDLAKKYLEKKFRPEEADDDFHHI